MAQKTKVVLLFGGQSIEHRVSLLSARNVIREIDSDKYSLSLIGIDLEGAWHWMDEREPFHCEADPEEIALGLSLKRVEPLSELRKFDVAFPILHGSLGEDGTVQGLLRLVGIPFVGADVLASAIAMDKDVMKRLLCAADIPVAPFFVLEEHERHRWSFEKIAEKLTPPFFVKPAGGGSSIGISKVNGEGEFVEALEEAFLYDQKILIEQAVEGREIECSVMGNEAPIISLPCEIKPKGEFHTYRSKYIDPEGAAFVIPVELTGEELTAVQQTALRAYQILGCSGMARADLFLTESGVFVNELNTIPGLTHLSPYAKMWEASGMPTSEMLDRLIGYAFKREEKRMRLQTEYKPRISL